MKRRDRIPKTSLDRLNAALEEAEQLSRLVREWEQAGYVVEIRSIANPRVDSAQSTAMDTYDPDDTVN